MEEKKRDILVKSSAEIIFRDFNLDSGKVRLPASVDDFQYLLDILTSQVAWLIDHDLERLKWILYRVDVNERKLQELLAAHPASEAAGAMAKMIIERQMEKAETRLRYKEGKL